MAFETSLNCLWLALGLAALASTVRSCTAGGRGCRSAPTWLHVCGVALIVAALFPYISATDDILRIQHLNAQQDKQHSAKKTANDELIRLYEAVDSPIICQVQQLSVAFVFLGLVALSAIALLSLTMPSESGRSPPAFA